LDHLAKAANHTTVVCGRVKLDPGLDTVGETLGDSS
jgi:hypothetical protein